MRRATVDYDALATSAPLNRDAAVARDGRGEHFDFEVDPSRAHWDAPPPTKPAPTDKPNLSGRKVGRLTVIGYYCNDKRGSKWLVRCVCGGYEIRRRKSITNPANVGDQCSKCKGLEDLKRSDYFRRTGRELAREN